jgi:hypothetical protein
MGAGYGKNGGNVEQKPPLPKRSRGAKASPVKVTKADGTVEIRPAYNKFQLRKAMRTRKIR